jgi:hypothetical protein
MLDKPTAAVVAQNAKENTLVVGEEPVIFQEREDTQNKRTSILSNERERGMYWILGESLSHILATVPSILDNACFLWCRESWLPAPLPGPPQEPQPDEGNQLVRKGLRALEYVRHVRPLPACPGFVLLRACNLPELD